MSRSTRPLAKRRVIAGYTQEGLAESLGVDPSTVARWERGTQLPRPRQRPDLARLLDVTLKQLDEILQPPNANNIAIGAPRDCRTTS